MQDKFDTDALRTILEEIGNHLARAQQLMDSVDPDSIFGARIQQLIDEVGDQGQKYDSKPELENDLKAEEFGKMVSQDGPTRFSK